MDNRDKKSIDDKLPNDQVKSQVSSIDDLVVENSLSRSFPSASFNSKSTSNSDSLSAEFSYPSTKDTNQVSSGVYSSTELSNSESKKCKNTVFPSSTSKTKSIFAPKATSIFATQKTPFNQSTKKFSSTPAFSINKTMKNNRTAPMSPNTSKGPFEKNPVPETTKVITSPKQSQKKKKSFSSVNQKMHSLNFSNAPLSGANPNSMKALPSYSQVPDSGCDLPSGPMISPIIRVSRFSVSFTFCTITFSNN